MHYFQLTSHEPNSFWSQHPSIQQLLTGHSQSIYLQQYDWCALYTLSAAGSLFLVLLYNRSLKRLNTLLSRCLKSQSDNCFSEQPFESAKPCNPQCCSDGATIAGDCLQLCGSQCELVSEKESFSGWFIVRIGANSGSELSQRQDTFLFQRWHSCLSRVIF